MKNRYSINKHNQLQVTNSRQKIPLVVNGEFSIDKHNRLIFWLNAPTAWRKIYDFGSKVIFEGKWRLNSSHDLLLILNQTRSQLRGNRMVIKANIISVTGKALVFQIGIQDRRGVSHLRILKLSGRWQTDKYNRLVFEVKKRTQPDILTLKGVWQVNKKQQITYTYQRTVLKRKTKALNTLTFNGFWQINSANRLTYILAGSPRSRFDFRVRIESPNLYPKKGVIKYRIGVGLRGERNFKRRTICLFGAWKFSRQLGLHFEMDYGGGRLKRMQLSTQVYKFKQNEVILTLYTKAGEPLGFRITLTRRFLKQLDAQAYLKLQKNLSRDAGIKAGLRLPF